MQEMNDATQKILSDSDDPSYATPKSSTPQQFSQPDLNDLVRDLGLSKNVAGNLVSRLQENALQNKTTKVSYFRNREQVFKEFLKRRISLFIVIISRIFSRI